MTPYEQAYRQAQQMKASGASHAELEDRARRFDEAWKFSSAAAFRAVAAE